MRLQLRLTVPLLIAAIAALAVASAQGAKPPTPPPPGQGPKLQLNPGTATFGPVAPDVGESQEFVLGFKNGTTSGGLSVTVSGGGFAITGDTCTGTAINTSNTCTVTVTYTPTGYGENVEGTLTASGKKGVKPASALLFGSSTDEPVESLVSAEPAFIYFGYGTIGEVFEERTIAFTNHAAEPLWLSGYDASAGFTASETDVWSTCDALQPGFTCYGAVLFEPSAPGLYEGSFTTTWRNSANATVATTETSLWGRSLADLVHASVTTWDFGSVTAGTVSAKEITFTNVSTDTTLVMDSDSMYGGEFANTGGTCRVAGVGIAIAAGETCTLSITFSPPSGITEATPYSGLFLTEWFIPGTSGGDDAVVAMTKIPLSGTGEPATLPALSINDAPWVYSNNNAIVTFTVTMSKTSGTNVTFNWGANDWSDTKTAAVWGTSCDGSADYTSAATTGTGTITAGQTTTTITFGTCSNGPANVYPLTTPTYFTVTISNPSGATITTDTGTGTIRIS